MFLLVKLTQLLQLLDPSKGNYGAIIATSNYFQRQHQVKKMLFCFL
jgi:hypothetical protein